MSFGFPAYHTEHYHPRATDEGIGQVVRRALRNLSWPIREETSNHILASTSMNLRSWGERVRIDFLPDGSISVTSKCALVTQCFDWGKNRRNVERLLARL